ncbi:MAG: hypothetical protein ACRC42_03210 [Mycoplasma sp.]
MILQQIIAPTITALVAISGLLILVSSYYLVFKLKRYIKKIDTYNDNKERLLKSYGSFTVKSHKCPIVNFKDIELENNQKAIQNMIIKVKGSDLKDIILKTHQKEISSIRQISNQSYHSVKRNVNLIKFLRLFHVQNGDEVEIRFFNDEYLSFYTIEKMHVLIMMIKKEDYSETMLLEEFHEKASTYQIYFINKSFIATNVNNPIKEFEEKLINYHKDYKYVLSKKVIGYNIFLQENFPGVKKYTKHLPKSLVRDERFLYERIFDKPLVDDKSFVKLQNELTEMKQSQGGK